MATTQRTQVETTHSGVSLSRGPALILGTFLIIAGLYFLYSQHDFPRLSQFPSGHAGYTAKAFFHIFGLNGWSDELTVAAGGLLLLGAAQHLLAKTASLIVAVVLGGVAIWALANHHSALGLFAANIWTIILWGASAVYLLINTLLPRREVTRETVVHQDPGGLDGRVASAGTTDTGTTDTEPPSRIRVRPAARAERRG